MFDFHVIDGTAVRQIVADDRAHLTNLIREAYLAHHAGDFRNPGSGFLRFPDRPDCRIIALPAHLGGDYDIAGLKWIASFPSNITANVPRASAVLLLNDGATGYPFACLEAAQISAARTAASAAVAAEALHGSHTVDRVAVVGAGVIARTIIDFLAAREWKIGRIDIHDLNSDYAALLAQHATAAHGYEAAVANSISDADIVIFATTAGEPHVTDPKTFRPGRLVLNISLRDLAPEIIVEADNILDSVEHCLTANTSPHLAEQRYGHRDFVTGTLAQVLLGQVKPAGDRPVIFSPFGMGVLDLVVGWHVFRGAVAADRTHTITDFFGQTERWATTHA
ncbi:ornithine cyclodeaminase [Kibdelosporangium banguiense]|uniref:Ornithine cyclodeaminase n=1 Tax=Kibdelosporangium banguiense TaxID=1365924 RepID=A0ABS4TTI3_9PSEU|nr:2,3-diaminopropionate biosynthesis protein SbnB [Kibdelosporangium banguiense]MBP2327309.1 ornithine cyclodeaminase [Kibdelosporangium banguiense]